MTDARRNLARIYGTIKMILMLIITYFPTMKKVCVIIMNHVT